MGAYLSKPITEKISTDEDEDRIKIGASSMQGWRETQEDAHNSLPNFDENTSFFAVYDGHGGREVALYCAQYLPQFIKNTKAYQNNDVENALIDGFLGFDGTLTTPEVIAELRQLMDEPKEESSIENENVNQLYEEASMPLDAVMEKYNIVNKHTALHLKDGSEKQPLSPYLRACKHSTTSKMLAKGNERTESENADSNGSTSVGTSSSISSSSDKNEVNTIDISKSKVEGVTEETKAPEVENKESDNEAPKSSRNVTDCKIKDTEKEKGCSSKLENNDAKKIDDEKPTKNDEKSIPSKESDIKIDEKSTEHDKKSTPSKEGILDTKPQENGKISKKGKVLAKTKGVVTPVKKIRPKRTARQIYRELLESEPESESEDEEDKSFQSPVDESSTDEDIADVPIGLSDESSDSHDVEGEEDEEDLEELNEEDDEEEDYDSDDEDNIHFGHDIPGSDSGCTAVVALMRGNKLFVANAGDSRCIVCRDGKAMDMSIDHKPEDNNEYKRIIKAGGRLSSDGRVNGGLNLSRAIGDHAYKQNKDLPDREQMITALPDIQTITITPSDEFMVLACDGIWNFMSSQEVADFIKCRLEKQPGKLSEICEELFDNCLASNTMGDGTGCDNMSAIIVNFKSSFSKRAASSDILEEVSNPKRAKTDDESIVQGTAA